MTIFIPMWVFWIPAIWMLIGAALWIPLGLWANTKISPKRTTKQAILGREFGWGDFTMRFLINTVIWPLVIWDIAR